MTEIEKSEETAGEKTPATTEHPWVRELERYPERSPEEDSAWPVRIARGWLWIALFFTSFVITLIILGVFYD